METSDQKAALQEIQEMKRQIRIKSSARLFCCMHTGDKNYVYSMDNQEKILDSYLEKAKKLSLTYKLKDEVYKNFQQEAAKIIYTAAIRRNELEWALHFAEKYGLDKTMVAK